MYTKIETTLLIIFFLLIEFIGIYYFYYVRMKGNKLYKWFRPFLVFVFIYSLYIFTYIFK